MNQTIVNEETDILCYRLRTARQRKRATREGFERKLRALDRERTELWHKKHNLGWIELKPPVMRGWKRFFVLRQDVAKGKHADFFQGILDRINTTEYSSRKDFKKKKKERGKKMYVVREQQLEHPFEWQMKKLNFTRNEMAFFEERILWSKSSKKFYKIYVFKEPWRFVLRIRPNMITRTRLRSEVMETRYAELDNYFERNHLEPTLFKVLGQSYRDGWWHDEDFKKDDYEFKNVPLPQILDRIKEY